MANNLPNTIGDVEYTPNADKAHCKKCGYTWSVSLEERIKFTKAVSKGVKIRCPMCFFKAKVHDGKIKCNQGGELTFNVGSLMNVNSKTLIDYINGKNALNFYHSECRNKFLVTIGSIKPTMDCPICKENPVEHTHEYYTNYKGYTSTNRLTAQPVDEKARLRKEVAEANGLKPEVTDNNEYIRSSEQESIYLNKMCSHWRNNVDFDKMSPTIAKVAKQVLKYDGQVFKERVLIRGINSRDECVCQCVYCGAEVEIPLSQLVESKNWSKLMVCSLCDGATSKGDYATKIMGRYKGDVHNGLKIVRVYSGKGNITLCDCVCTSYFDLPSKCQLASRRTGHTITGLNFGDVINNRVFCPECAKNREFEAVLAGKILNFGNNNGCIYCKKFRPIKYKSDKIGNNPNKFEYIGISPEDFLTSDKSVCDFCTFKDDCTLDRTDLALENIRKGMDLAATRKEINQYIKREFPSIWDSSGSCAKNGDSSKSLMIYGNAFIGRDSKPRKFCKCTVHKTEMMLDGDEIKTFNHEQCLSSQRSLYRFFNVDNKYLIDMNKKNLDEAKKKKANK